MLMLMHPQRKRQVQNRALLQLRRLSPSTFTPVASTVQVGLCTGKKTQFFSVLLKSSTEPFSLCASDAQQYESDIVDPPHSPYFLLRRG